MMTSLQVSSRYHLSAVPCDDTLPAALLLFATSGAAFADAPKALDAHVHGTTALDAAVAGTANSRRKARRTALVRPALYALASPVALLDVAQVGCAVTEAAARQTGSRTAGQEVRLRISVRAGLRARLFRGGGQVSQTG